MSLDIPFKPATTADTALSIPFFTSTALDPCVIALIPSFTITAASNVEVVVPSPALSADLTDTLLII